MSGYIDALTGNKMGNFLKEYMPIEIDFLADYPDFFSFVVVLLLAVILAVGVKESTIMNNIFTSVNIVTVLIVLVAGGIKCKLICISFFLFIGRPWLYNKIFWKTCNCTILEVWSSFIHDMNTIQFSVEKTFNFP